MRDQVLIRASTIKQLRRDASRGALNREKSQLEMLDRIAHGFSQRLRRKTQFRADASIDRVQRRVSFSFFHRIYDIVSELPVCTVSFSSAKPSSQILIDVSETTGLPQDSRFFSEAEAIRHCCDLVIDTMAASLAAGFMIVDPDAAVKTLVQATDPTT